MEYDLAEARETMNRYLALLSLVSDPATQKVLREEIAELSVAIRRMEEQARRREIRPRRNRPMGEKSGGDRLPDWKSGGSR